MPNTLLLKKGLNWFVDNTNKCRRQHHAGTSLRCLVVIHVATAFSNLGQMYVASNVNKTVIPLVDRARKTTNRQSFSYFATVTKWSRITVPMELNFTAWRLAHFNYGRFSTFFAVKTGEPAAAWRSNRRIDCVLDYRQRVCQRRSRCPDRSSKSENYPQGFETRWNATTSVPSTLTLEHFLYTPVRQRLYII